MAADRQVNGALAGALARNREKLNAQYDYFTRVLRRNVDPEELSIHLMVNVAPVAQAVEAVDPARVDKAVEELFGVSLELIGAGYIGERARHKWPEKVFMDLLPAAARFLAANPRLVAASLVNAAVAMEGEPSARVGDWVDGMKSAAAVAETVKDYLDAGMALSWRCGMAHYRRGALALMETIPERILFSIFETAPSAPAGRADLLEALANPWPASEEKGEKENRKPAAVAGGFTGFGGPFTQPPVVFLEDGAIAAGDGVNTFSVFADRFGAVVKRRQPGPYPAKIPAQDKDTEKHVMTHCPALRAVRSLAKSWAWDGATLAVTLSVSHKIFIFPLPGA